MSKIGAKYTDELIKERAESIGYTVTRIVREDKIPFVYMQCKCGAKRTVKAHSIQEAKCVYCEGKRNRKEDVLSKLDKEGYTLQGELEESEDTYGNKFIKVSNKMDVTCKGGHERTIKVFDLYTRPECTVCNGKINNSGFSRSEEIIHRILEYNNIVHERQYKIPNTYEGLRLDFFLPELNIIIEYDGDHHRYKRSYETDEEFTETLRRDRIRDTYATDNNIRMVRIQGDEAGKSLVYVLRDELKEYVHIDISDEYYDEIVRDVFDECSRKYGWLSYEEVKTSADIRKNNTWSTINLMEGYSVAVTNRHFKWIYGMTKQEFYG